MNEMQQQYNKVNKKKINNSSGNKLTVLNTKRKIVRCLPRLVCILMDSDSCWF